MGDDGASCRAGRWVARRWSDRKPNALVPTLLGGKPQSAATRRDRRGFPWGRTQDGVGGRRTGPVALASMPDLLSTLCASVQFWSEAPVCQSCSLFFLLSLVFFFFVFGGGGGDTHALRSVPAISDPTGDPSDPLVLQRQRAWIARGAAWSVRGGSSVPTRLTLDTRPDTGFPSRPRFPFSGLRMCITGGGQIA